MKRILMFLTSLFTSGYLVAQDVQFVQVQQVNIDTKIVIDGHVEAINESTVSAQVNAKVKKIYVDVDDRVAAGTRLIVLDDSELKAQFAKVSAALNVAQAQAKQADTEYQRLLGLKNDSFVSDNDMTKAQSAVQVANANVDLAKAQIAEVSQLLTYTTITAPYAGVVTARHIEVGETANFGQPLLTGFALNQNRINVQVPNSLIEQVEQTGQMYALDKNGTWQPLTNLIIAPNADKQTHTVMVRANISKSLFNHRPGSFIKVAVATNPRVAFVVPKTAIINQGDFTAVYVDIDNKPVLRQVVIGNSDGDQTEILSGLSLTDNVVLNGAAHLAQSL